MNEHRSPGRRGIDQASLLKWTPFLSLIALMLLQTVYFTRYVSGLESTNAQLVATVAEMKNEIKTLRESVSGAAVPSATMNLRMDFLEARINELRGMANDNSRRITQVETRGMR